MHCDVIRLADVSDLASTQQATVASYRLHRM